MVAVFVVYLLAQHLARGLSKHKRFCAIGMTIEMFKWTDRASDNLELSAGDSLYGPKCFICLRIAL